MSNHILDLTFVIKALNGQTIAINVIFNDFKRIETSEPKERNVNKQTQKAKYPSFL